MAKILQLNIELEEIRPTIWRNVLVEDSITFQELHDIIQTAMGWENYHLYEFSVNGERIAPEEEGFNPAEAVFDTLFKSPEFKKMLEQETGKRSGFLETDKLNSLLQTAKRNKKKNRFTINTELCKVISLPNQKVAYRYDFGDNWEHTITVEKILEKDETQSYPACIAGERACPPEDCGGMHGYYELMDIRKNKKHTEYREKIIGWLGEDYDPEHFNAKEVNDAILLEFAIDINEYIRKKSGNSTPIAKLLLEDNDEIKNVNTLKEKESEYADLLGPIENTIAVYYAENKGLKDKDVVKAIKNIRLNQDKEIGYYHEPLEKFILIRIASAIKKRKTMKHELWLAFSYVLWCIDNRKHMNYSRAYLDWILHFFGMMEPEEAQAFEKRYDDFGKAHKIDKERIEAMKGNPSDAQTTDEEDFYSKKESEAFAKK